jgi:hypothetical protein
MQTQHRDAGEGSCHTPEPRHRDGHDHRGAPRHRGVLPRPWPTATRATGDGRARQHPLERRRPCRKRHDHVDAARAGPRLCGRGSATPSRSGSDGRCGRGTTPNARAGPDAHALSDNGVPAQPRTGSARRDSPTGNASDGNAPRVRARPEARTASCLWPSYAFRLGHGDAAERASTLPHADAGRRGGRWSGHRRATAVLDGTESVRRRRAFHDRARGGEATIRSRRVDAASQSSNEKPCRSWPGPGESARSIAHVRLPTRAERCTFTGSSALRGSTSLTSTM